VLLGRVLRDLCRDGGPWADQRHVATQDVDQVRDLVQRGGAQPPAHPGDPRLWELETDDARAYVRGSAVIDQLMVRMRDRLGVTSIVITHDMRSAYTVGTRIAMLYEGRVRKVGTVDEIRHTTDPVVRQFIEGRPTLDPEIQEQQA